MAELAQSSINTTHGNISTGVATREADLQYSRSSTIIPPPQQKAGSNSALGSSGVIEGFSQNAQASGYFGKQGTNNIIAEPTAAKLETLPQQSRTETNSYQVLDREQLDFRLREFRQQLNLAQSAFNADVKYGFALDKMDPKTQAALGEVAKAINMMDTLPGMQGQKFTIHGHTDSKGEDTGYDNQALSERRANDLKAALVKMGANPDRIDAIGHGASQPIAENVKVVSGNVVDNPEGRALNRRAELGFSMTELEMQSYFRQVEGQIQRDSVTTINESRTIPVERPEIAHLRVEYPQNAFMGSGNSQWNESPEQREAREAAKAAAEAKRNLEAQELKRGLDKMINQKTDLKLSEHNGQTYDLALRADKDAQGNYMLSVYSPHNNKALYTMKYTSAGFSINSTGSWRQVPEEAIVKGLRDWGAKSN